MSSDGDGQAAELTAFLAVLCDHHLLEASELDPANANADANHLLEQLFRSGSLTAYQMGELRRGDGQRLILGQYILLEPLGEGGMGQVFKARHQKMRRTVALKVIRKEVATLTGALKRFEQEIAAAAQLSHPNVIQAYDANEVDGVHFFVMEFVEGVDLSQLVKRLGPRPVPLACDYIRQAAEGLQHAHERGLVHRDIKPSNLLLGYKDGVVKILDLGLARLSQAAQGEAAQLTSPGTVMGTLDYLSPEQAQDARSADIRSDLYSLGCSFYFLLTGQPPFPEGNYTEKLLKHLMDQPPPLSQLRPDVPPELETIVAKLLAKSPGDRYQIPTELVEALTPLSLRETRADHYRPDAPNTTAGPATPLSSLRPPDGPKADNRRPPSSSSTRSHELPASRPGLPRTEPLAPTSSGTAKSATFPLEGSFLGPNVDLHTLAPPSAPTPEVTGALPLRSALPPLGSVKGRPSIRKRPTNAVAIVAVATLLVTLSALFGILLFWPLLFPGSPVVVVAPPHPSALALVPVSIPGPTATVASAEIVVPVPTKPKDPPTKPLPPTRSELPPTHKDPESVKPPPPPPPPVLTGDLLTTRYKPITKNSLRAVFSPDGRWLVVGWEEAVERWDLRNDREKPPAPVRLPLWGHPLEGLAVDNDGRVLVNAVRDYQEAGSAVAKPYPTISWWDPAEDSPDDPGRPFRHSRDLRAILSVAFADKKFFLSGSLDRGEVRLWNVDVDKAEARVFRKHTQGIDALVAAADGSVALSGGRDNAVVLYDLKNSGEPRILGKHDGSVVRLAVGPRHVAMSVGLDLKFRVWDLEKEAAGATFAVPGDLVRSLAVAPDGTSFLAGLKVRDREQVIWWDLNGKPLAEPYAEAKGPFIAVAFSGDGQYALAYSAGDQKLRRWKLAR